MPSRSTPAGMPRRVHDLVETLGNPLRTAILHELARQPMSAVELAEALEVAHSSVHRGLVRLEAAGAVTADVLPADRVGNRHVRWILVPARVQELGEAWIAYVRGSDQS